MSSGALSEVRTRLLIHRDEILAVGLWGFGLAELVGHEVYQGREAWPGPWPAGLAQVCLLTLPLAWRRRAPLTSTVVIMTAVAGSSVWWGAAESTAAFLAMLVTVFSGVAYARRPWIAVAVSVAAVAVHNAYDPSVVSVVDWFWSAGFTVVAMLLGAAVRSRQTRIATLTQDAESAAREYDDRVAAATAAERAAIARELHDVVAHAVSVIVIHAQVGERAVDDDPETVRKMLGSIEASARSAMDDLRRLLRLLSVEDTPLDPSPGLAQLDALAAGFRDAGLAVSLDLPEPLPPLSGAADLAAYRLVQEALTNTLRHAPGARASVRATVRDGALELVAEDDGPGVAAGDEGPGLVASPTSGSGRGLIGMRERVSMAGGTVLAIGPSGDGFRVRARLPLTDPALGPVA